MQINKTKQNTVPVSWQPFFNQVQDLCKELQIVVCTPGHFPQPDSWLPLLACSTQAG